MCLVLKKVDSFWNLFAFINVHFKPTSPTRIKYAAAVLFEWSVAASFKFPSFRFPDTSDKHLLVFLLQQLMILCRQ